MHTNQAWAPAGIISEGQLRVVDESPPQAENFFGALKCSFVSFRYIMNNKIHKSNIIH